MPDRLYEILNGLQAQLEGNLRATREAVEHSGALGAATEDDWLHVLKDHLPHRYQADRAFVIDSSGATSDQIDIVIYDRQYSPFLYNKASQRFVPAESVYAILEVKQDLNKDHVEYAGQKAASVRCLTRTSVPIPYAEGEYRARPLPRIIAGLLVYKSSWSPPFGDAFHDVLGTLDEQEQLDIGCSLMEGAFEASYEAEHIVNVKAIEGPHSLVQFFMRLLRQLQALATVPAIDYEAYLERFSRNGREI